jgi:NAD(P)-dependent dehydrogenase (short-subunit alcohol dehydrogenase family)
MRLSDQTILVTGAAGLIGSAVSQKVFDAGANVILTDISAQGLRELSEKLSTVDNSRVYAVDGDISTSEGIDSIISECNHFPGPINGAVHCAYPRSPGWGSDFQQLQANNLNHDLTKQLGGAILFSQKIMSLFQDHGGGSLVHISSIQGIRAPKFDHYEGTNMSSPIEYAAIKAGIISITAWLAKYYSNQNIRVNCISPGGLLDAQPQPFLKKYRASCSNIGMLQSEHVASSVTYLLSADAAAVNGHNLIVDDGWSL